MLPQTLPELLHIRALENTHDEAISFIDPQTQATTSISHRQLFDSSIVYASRLLAAGLKRSDIVLSSFTDHESHIRLFWACCMAGIVFCPLPALHPDESRQVLLFEHLQLLFGTPTLVAQQRTVVHIRRLCPDLQCLETETLPSDEIHSKLVSPVIHPSPSDPVCFMLTSGSTGNSKAVVLRHSNILSSIRGKIAHHGSSSDSRFLNWIAFDHVACVTEVHLQALQANARQWHLSPSAIIHRPVLLLELVSRLKITYIFSPNFLLAQILRDHREYRDSTLDFSRLVAFISGGEAVPMDTAVEFADLLENHGAQRNVLRGGFGMSETGAGCIYDTRPIPRATSSKITQFLSLGKCCPGVEMRVVADATCTRPLQCGKVGHLQLRGSSVFSKYFGNEQATMESFTSDGWFITGDLALVDEEANLHLQGREKECIIINGVKYLPKDVCRYIEDSSVSGIIPGQVYVSSLRLDGAATETYVIFYQHSLILDDELNSPEIIETNYTIARLATVFCSAPPHAVLPLPATAFVKTALGKISTSQLVKSLLKEEYDHIQSNLQTRVESLQPLDISAPIEKILVETLRKVFMIETPQLYRSDNIFLFGASSMHLLRLKQSLQDQLSISNIPTIELLKRPLLGDLIDFLSTQTEKEAVPEYQPLVCLSSSGSKPPLFLIHPGVGEILVFVNLAHKLEDRPVYALRARGFEYDETPFESLGEMVNFYTSAIESCHPGPYYIAGYSYGGAVAFEVAKALESHEKPVAFLGIFNLPPFIQFRMHELTWSEVFINLCVFLSLFPEGSLDSLRESLSLRFPQYQLQDGIPEDISAPVRYILDKGDQNRLQQLDLSMDAFVRWVKVAFAVNLTGKNYTPTGRVNGALMTVFCAVPLSSMGSRTEFKEERLSQWREFCGDKFEMVDVEGEHYTMLSETHVTSFSSRLKEALARAHS
ncbi:AMP-dependent synthetase and ligase [Mycena floridula]|nr:AMP-dependent synthetase and ligase [Mycena floridula]